MNRKNNFKNIEYILIALVILFSPVNKFFLSIGFRIQYYEFFGILFIITIFLKRKSKILNFKLDAITFYIFYQWIFIFLIFLSLISFIYINKTKNELAFFFKGLVLVLFSLTILTFLLSFLKSVKSETQKKVLDIFIFAIFLSSIYGILQIFLFIYFTIDLDNILSNTIPFTGNELDITDLALGSFFRLTGFTSDPSVQASFSILVIVLLNYYIFVLKKYNYIYLYIIILLSFIMTMSGSGLIGLSSSLVIIFIGRLSKINGSKLILSFITSLPIILIFYFFKEDVLFFFNHKFEQGGTTKIHAEIAQNALNIGLKYPFFGVGFNNFSFTYQQFYGDPNYNAHNSWLNYFVETGFFGFIYKLFNFLIIIFLILRKKSNFKFYFLGGIIGLNISTLGYETLNFFFNQSLILVMLYFYLTGYFDKLYYFSSKKLF